MVCFLYIHGGRSGLRLTFVRLLVTTALCHHCSVLLTGLFTRSQLHLGINKKHEGSCYCFYYLFMTALQNFSSHLTLSAFPLRCHLPALFYKRAGDSFIFFFWAPPPPPPPSKKTFNTFLARLCFAQHIEISQIVSILILRCLPQGRKYKKYTLESMKYKTNTTTCGKRRGKRWKLVCRWAPARGLAVGSNRKSMFIQPSPSPEHPLLTLLGVSPNVSEEDGKPDSLKCLKN